MSSYRRNFLKFGASGDLKNIPNCECLHGEPYVTPDGGCGCKNNDIVKTVFPTPPLAYVSTATYNTTQPANPKTDIAKVLQTVNQGQSLTDILKNNKWLVLAGALGLGYMFVSGGLSASDRTVTSVTRYARRAK